MIEPLRNNNDNNDNNNNNILRDILPLCRDIVSDRIDGKIISNSMASSRLALPCPSPRMDESLSTRPPPIEQDEKDEKFHFDVPLKPAWFNIGPLFRRFRRSIVEGSTQPDTREKGYTRSRFKREKESSPTSDSILLLALPLFQGYALCIPLYVRKRGRWIIRGSDKGCRGTRGVINRRHADDWSR